MLPKALTEDICSLRHGVDRVAFSVLWELTPDGEILKDRTKYTKSLIRYSSPGFSNMHSLMQSTHSHLLMANLSLNLFSILLLESG